jgi:hypothetical protein
VAISDIPFGSTGRSSTAFGVAPDPSHCENFACIAKRSSSTSATTQPANRDQRQSGAKNSPDRAKHREGEHDRGRSKERRGDDEGEQRAITRSLAFEGNR